MINKNIDNINQANSLILTQVYCNDAREEMLQIVEAIARSDRNIENIISTNQSIEVKSGFIAEEMHTATFNQNAILKHDNARAYTDRYEEWHNLKWHGRNLEKNDLPDVVISTNGRDVVHTSQSKYCATPESTTKQMSQAKNSNPKYEKVDTLLGPEDQINTYYKKVPGEPDPVPTTTIKEHAQAKADALKARGGDEAQIKAYEQTAAKCSDKIAKGKVSSNALSKKDASSIAVGDMSKKRQMENEVKNTSIKNNMQRAGVRAAAYSAISVGVTSTLQHIQQVNEGRITAEEATQKIVCETVVATADSCIKASLNAGAQGALVKSGYDKLIVQSMAKMGLGAMVKTNAITVGVVCAVDAVKDLVRLGTGQMSSQEFFDRQGKGVLMTSSGVTGGAVGLSAGTAVATSLGLSVGSTGLAVLELLGGISGGLIAGIAMTLAIENGIEKPYRDLIKNTANLQDAARELNRLSNTMFRGQALFTKFIEADMQMGAVFQDQMKKVDDAGKRALEAINLI